MKSSTSERIAAALVALAAGLPGATVVLVYSISDDIPSWFERIVVHLLVFFAPGLVVGFYFPRRWMSAGLVAWGGVALVFALTLAAWRGDTRFADAPLVQFTVHDGSIAIEPVTVPFGDLRIRQENKGETAHELAIVEASSPLDIQTIQGRPRLRPLEPGESDVSYWGGGMFRAGRHAVVCIRHIPTGETAEFTVKVGQ